MSVKFLKISAVYEIIAKNDTNWDENPLFVSFIIFLSQNERIILEKEHVSVM